jgi:hypothetical protein
MEAAGYVPSEPIRANFHIRRIAGAQGISKIIEGVQDYLDSWSKERITDLQKMDGGWGPFDERQQPLKISGAGAVHCSRDAIHRHCIALAKVGIPLTPELMELSEFFDIAGKLIEGYGEAALQEWRPENRTRIGNLRLL